MIQAYNKSTTPRTLSMGQPSASVVQQHVYDHYQFFMPRNGTAGGPPNPTLFVASPLIGDVDLYVDLGNTPGAPPPTTGSA